MADRPKRRWYQYSLRALLGFFLVAAWAFGWLGCKIQRIRDERNAAAQLQAVGARIERYETEDSLPDQWLWKWFGDAPVRTVDLRKTQATDADLERLERLTRPEEVLLDETQVTDAGMEHLVGLRVRERITFTMSQRRGEIV